VLVTLAAVNLGTPALSQQVLPFVTKHAHVTKLTDGCFLASTTILAKPSGTPVDWGATAYFVLRRIKDENLYKSITVDLRRSDEDDRPRDENGLAHISVTAPSKPCPNAEDRIDYSYVASRVLTERDFKIRKLHLTLNEVGFDNVADDLAEKLFKLKKGWHLPSVGMHGLKPIFAVSPPPSAMDDADLLIQLLKQKAAK
jgi:hypothetical protein